MLKVLLVVLLIALAVWFVVRVALRRIDGGPSAPPPRVVGPDDDPDFLRGLDRRRRDPEDD
ncbi:hypothetical protein KDN32_18045 [Nocardioides sp. J2M5]|uniref:hypothetical protein n=1 Tax=Nocardioides palaemonis TaxID=2829810 RepID=UPI001BA9FD5B|nr:hypothetical protein [Nocardioides palaemonis]MBS2939646.1 hypothetical protein [Nocardioides palaemonis]